MCPSTNVYNPDLSLPISGSWLIMRSNTLLDFSQSYIEKAQNFLVPAGVYFLTFDSNMSLLLS